MFPSFHYLSNKILSHSIECRVILSVTVFVYLWVSDCLERESPLSDWECSKLIVLTKNNCIQFSEIHSINALRRANEILAALGRPNSMSQFIALVNALVHQHQWL